MTKLGSSLNISCHASGEPSPSYLWKLGSEELQDVSDDGELILHDVPEDASGDLTCVAENSEGQFQA